MTRGPLLLLLLAPAATAHPLPNMRYDRTVHVRLSDAAVVVKYTLDLTQWTMVIDGRPMMTTEEQAKYTTFRDMSRIYAERKSVFLADNLRATANGKDLTFRVEKASAEPDRDHLKFKFVFRAEFKPAGGSPAKFAFEDQNFDDKSGAMTLTLDADESLTVHELDEPVGLRNKSPYELKPGEELLLRKASATVESKRPPEPTPSVSPPVPVQEPVVGEVIGEKPEIVHDVWNRGLSALFDSDRGIAVLLLLAAFWGTAHAFTPGHGKTLMAAYLVGERGTIFHAFTLGAATTFAHTGSVILVAAISSLVFGDQLPVAFLNALQLLGPPLMIVGGLWLFIRRLKGQRDHLHLFAGGQHRFCGGCAPEEQAGPVCGKPSTTPKPPTVTTIQFVKTAPKFVEVLVLGLLGGIIPCVEAVLLLMTAAAAGRLGFTVPLLLAFSVGLGAALVAVGVGVVYANRAGGKRFSGRGWYRALPAVSAVLVIGMGLWHARAFWLSAKGL